MNKLKELKANAGSLSLINTRENMESILKNASSSTYVELLANVFQSEINYRHDKAKVKRIKEAGFPYIRRLEDFDLEFCKSITERQLRQLAELTMRSMVAGQKKLSMTKTTSF
ncbi:MAG: ATP-binding protein [Desulfitobacteriaceae bacterium]|nr:ATP-binding protein [Desulfitobacteriaceae bacterium]MDD4346475.1 ATP-binding protein [Desulfitobacteriaceae bacterium]MDD4401267.1 ATP-binding protein [Desulfitobacteriaceae bacterium]